jgi:mitochondrial chaperone BCS1
MQALLSSQLRAGIRGGPLACPDVLGAQAANSTSSWTDATSTDSSGFGAGAFLARTFGNELFIGGFLLIIVQSLLGWFVGHLTEALNRFKQRFMFTAVVDETDVTFDWFLVWLGSHEYAKTAKATTIRSSWTPSALGLQGWTGPQGRGGVATATATAAVTGSAKRRERKRPSITLIPAFGSHVLSFQGKWVVVSRIEEEGAAAAGARPAGFRGAQQSAGAKPKKISLCVFGRDGRATIDRLIEGVMENHARLQKGVTQVMTATSRFGGQCHWSTLASKQKRPISSVVMAEGLSEEIRHDVQMFLDSEEWYHQCGVPYRRGYVLSGPPGTGKTSFLLALAGELDLDLCVLNISKPELTDDALLSLFSEAPTDSILLLEDVDAAFRSVGRGETEDVVKSDTHDEEDEHVLRPPRRGRHASAGARSRPGGSRMLGADDAPSEGVTFSGLLNAIDGVASQEGRLLFMTTNHLDVLPPALIRPGRVDKRWVVDLASTNQVRRMFLKFFPDEPESADAVASSIPSMAVSPAALQGFFMQFRENPTQCPGHVKQFLAENQRQ